MALCERSALLEVVGLSRPGVELLHGRKGAAHGVSTLAGRCTKVGVEQHPQQVLAGDEFEVRARQRGIALQLDPEAQRALHGALTHLVLPQVFLDERLEVAPLAPLSRVDFGELPVVLLVVELRRIHADHAAQFGEQLVDVALARESFLQPLSQLRAETLALHGRLVRGFGLLRHTMGCVRLPDLEQQATRAVQVDGGLEGELLQQRSDHAARTVDLRKLHADVRGAQFTAGILEHGLEVCLEVLERDLRHGWVDCAGCRALGHRRFAIVARAEEQALQFLLREASVEREALEVATECSGEHRARTEHRGARGQAVQPLVVQDPPHHQVAHLQRRAIDGEVEGSLVLEVQEPDAPGRHLRDGEDAAEGVGQGAQGVLPREHLGRDRPEDVGLPLQQEPLPEPGLGGRIGHTRRDVGPEELAAGAQHLGFDAMGPLQPLHGGMEDPFGGRRLSGGHERKVAVAPQDCNLPRARKAGFGHNAAVLMLWFQGAEGAQDAPQPVGFDLQSLGWVDLTALGILGLFFLIGLWKGLVWQVSRVIILAASVWMASRWGRGLGNLYSSWCAGDPTPQQVQTANYLAYATVFLAVLVVLSLLALAVQNFVKKAGMTFFDRLGGGVFGVVTGAVGFVCLLTAAKMFLPGSSVVMAAEDSRSLLYARQGVERLGEVVPDDLRVLYELPRLRQAQQQDATVPRENGGEQASGDGLAPLSPTHERAPAGSTGPAPAAPVAPATTPPNVGKGS